MKRLTILLMKCTAIFIPLGILLMVVGMFTGAKGAIYFSDGRIKIKNDEEYHYENYDITGIKDIHIDISNAAIIVKQSSDTRFGIDIELDSQTEKPKVEVKDDKININSSGGIFLTMDLFSLFDGKNNQIIITVPKGSDLNQIELDSSNGKIDIDSIVCDSLKAATSNGIITVQNIEVKDETDIHSSNGEIKALGKFNRLIQLRTSNGRITAEGTFTGDVQLKTSNGLINFQNSIPRKESNIYGKTNNGSIMVNSSKVSDTFKEDNHADNSVDAVTSNGTITIRFPDGT